MSFDAIKLVRSRAADANVKPDARHVLWELAERANDKTGLAWPSVDTRSLDTGLSRRAVQRALRELEEAGLIRARGPRTGGRSKATCYEVFPGKGATVTPLRRKRASDVPERASDTTRKGVRGAPEAVKNQEGTGSRFQQNGKDMQFVAASAAYGGSGRCKDCGKEAERAELHRQLGRCEECYPAYHEGLTGEAP